MRLCLDLQVLQGESAERGVGRYSAGLANAILQDGRVEAKILVNTALPARFEHAMQWIAQRGHGDKICTYHGPDRIMGLIAGNQRRWRFSSALYDGFVRKLGVDSVHMPAPFDGMGDDTGVGDGRLNINPGLFRTSTLYDLIPFEAPERYLADPRYRAWFEDRFEKLKACDCLFAISQHTRDVAIQFGIAPDKVVAISSDTDEIFRPLTLSSDERADLLSRIGIRHPFVMHTGILESRKNVKLLLDAFAQMPEDVRARHQIVLVANATDPQKQALKDHAIRSGIKPDQLVFAGHLDDLDLVRLYNLSELLVMPSLNEGFGLPLLEAMRCGTPVLGARATSIPEVVGSDEYLFDPGNALELSVKLHRLLTYADASAAARKYVLQQQASFSWKRSADIALTALLERRRERDQRARAANAKYYIVDSAATSAPPQSSGGFAAVPLLSIQDQDLSPLQERAILSGPFAAMCTPALEKLNVSRDIAYLCDGYVALLPPADSVKVPVAADSLRNIQNSVCVERVARHQLTAAEQNHFQFEEALQGIDIIDEIVRTVSQDCLPGEAAEFSLMLGANLSPRSRPRTIHVDISELVHRDARTGIQRVVRSILLSLLSKPQACRIEPVYREGATYRYARQFTARFLGLPALGLVDSYVVFNPGDTFLGLDLDATITPEALEFLKRQNCRGVRLVWVIYDILPVIRPEWFDTGLAKAVTNWVNDLQRYADTLVCISETVAVEIGKYYLSRGEGQSMPRVSWWHLGADLEGSAPSRGVSSAEQALLDAIPGELPVFLTVGTVEPRKGIHKLLDGAEAFWAAGGQACFVIVGKKGWSVEVLAKRIRGHAEFGVRLFWFEGASDEVLARLYSRATAGLLPSEGEGFGLPLVEAARQGLPIIARNIPVFREVAGPNAFFFTDETPDAFSASLDGWLKLYRRNQHPKPDFDFMTWEQSADRLMEIVSEA